MWEKVCQYLGHVIRRVFDALDDFEQRCPDSALFQQREGSYVFKSSRAQELGSY